MLNNIILTFIQQLFDKTVAKTKEMFNIGGSAIQDTVNILSPTEIKVKLEFISEVNS